MDIVKVALIRKDMKLKEGTQLVVFLEEDLFVVKNRDLGSFFAEAAEFAATHHVFLVPGLYLRDDYLCSCVMDNQGNVIGEQKATHLNRAWFDGLKRGSEINIIGTPFGKLFLCPDVDIYKPEVLRIATLLGAEIVVSSQYIAEEDFNEAMILAGAWQQAQQNCLYIIHSTNITGNIIGPCNVVEDLSGFMARTVFKKDELETSLSAELSAEKRKKAYAAFPVFKSLNLKLYKNHFRELCE